MERAYQEVIEFIAGGTTPQNFVAFRPCEAAQARGEWGFARVSFSAEWSV